VDLSKISNLKSGNCPLLITTMMIFQRLALVTIALLTQASAFVIISPKRSACSTLHAFPDDLAACCIRGPLLSGLLALTVVAAPALAVSGGGLDYAGTDISGQDFSGGDYKGKDFTQGTVCTCMCDTRRDQGHGSNAIV
jgi:hypothetical protein